MSDTDFSRTGMGRDFFQRHVPRIADALERAAAAADRMLVLLNAWLSTTQQVPALTAASPDVTPELTDAGLQALVDGAARGEIDAIVVCEPERLGRGTDRQITVLRTLTGAGLAVVCVGPQRAVVRTRGVA